MSLEDVARITKIQPRILERLETGRLEGLPAEVFVRGFVRNVARCVGLDEDEALRRYAACASTAAAAGAGSGDASGPGGLAGAGAATARALVESMSDLAPAAADGLRTRARKAPTAPPTMEAPPAAWHGAEDLPGSAVTEVAGPAQRVASASEAAAPVAADPSGPAVAPALDLLAALLPVRTGDASADPRTDGVDEVACEPLPIASRPSEPADADAPRSKKRRKGARRRRGQADRAAIEGAAPASTSVDVAQTSASGASGASGAPGAVAPTEPGQTAALHELTAPPSERLAPSDGDAPQGDTMAVETAVVQAVAAGGNAEARPTVVPSMDASAVVAAPPAELLPASAEVAATANIPEETWSPRMPAVSAPIPPWRRGGRPQRRVAPASPSVVMVIDDADPERAAREAEERAAVRDPVRRSFLPPILLDREDRSSRQGGLTLAVIILLIAATLTLSYLMRRPSSSGDGITRAAPGLGSSSADA